MNDRDGRTGRNKRYGNGMNIGGTGWCLRVAMRIGEGSEEPRCAGVAGLGTEIILRFFRSIVQREDFIFRRLVSTAGDG